MISSKNPWHSILLRKKDYQKSNMSKQKESKRSKKLFVDLLEGMYQTKIALLFLQLLHCHYYLHDENQDIIDLV